MDQVTLSEDKSTVEIGMGLVSYIYPQYVYYSRYPYSLLTQKLDLGRSI